MSRAVLALVIAILLLIIGIGGWMMMRRHNGRRFRERDPFHDRASLEERRGVAPEGHAWNAPEGHRGTDADARQVNDPEPQGEEQPSGPYSHRHRQGFSGSNSAAGQPGEPSSTEQPPSSIGVATMKRDGTIVMNLRAEGPDGTIGEAVVQYAPSDKEYAGVLQHLGGLRPGEHKMVPPWSSPN